MVASDELKAMGIRILQRLMERPGVFQACVFNSEGDPFWAGRWPLSPDELRLLDEATTLLVETEKSKPKPFLVHDTHHRFTAASLEEDTDLYLVLMHARDVIEARMTMIFSEAAHHLHPVRNPPSRIAWLAERTC